MTNPVTDADRTFLKHFSMLIGILVLVMFSLIGVALYLYSKNPPPTNPSHTDEVQQRIAPVGGVYAGDLLPAAIPVRGVAVGLLEPVRGLVADADRHVDG